jgi:ceramide glucosyltransferase
MFETLLLLLIAAGWIYWLVALWMVRSHFRPRPKPDPDFAPPVSILKPVKGLDAEAYENYASFCQQDYPDYELLFGMADPDDPAIELVERLKADYPELKIRWAIGHIFGSNRKASLLHNLVGEAQHELLVISDSDMRVKPDYLRRVVAPLARSEVGLVTCPYQGQGARSLVAKLEALHMGTLFLPSVVIASDLFRLPFAMGSTVALRKSDLRRMGGFRAIADHLADDHEVGARIAELGLRVYLSDYVTISFLNNASFQELWQRELRWNRCIRVCEPAANAGLPITFTTPLALLLLPVSGFSLPGWLALAFTLALRYLVAWMITGYTGDTETRHWLHWLPLRDCLSLATWSAGLVGRQVAWRGEWYYLQADGRMTALPHRAGSSLWRRLAWWWETQLRHPDGQTR